MISFDLCMDTNITYHSMLHVGHGLCDRIAHISFRREAKGFDTRMVKFSRSMVETSDEMRRNILLRYILNLIFDTSGGGENSRAHAFFVLRAFIDFRLVLLLLPCVLYIFVLAHSLRSIHPEPGAILAVGVFTDIATSVEFPARP